MTSRKRIVIVGATSAIARQCARLWVKDHPSDIILLGRNEEKLAILAADLKVRSPKTRIPCMQADFINPDHIQSVVNQIYQEGPVTMVLIAHGFLPLQKLCQENLNLCREALAINALSPVLFAEAFATHMQKVNKGTLAVIGSVAGDRSRKSNYVYGAAKGMIERYVQGLQHRFSHSQVKVILIKPGPTDTPMTTHLKESGRKMAGVDRVAMDMVRGIAQGKRVIYTPRIWRFIMGGIRHLPYFIFNRMDI